MEESESIQRTSKSEKDGEYENDESKENLIRKEKTDFETDVPNNGG